MPISTPAPANEAGLIQLCQDLQEMTLAQVAESLGQAVPPNLMGNKGWVGQLLELALGATAGNEAAPDFQHLGIELKTIPVNSKGQPIETTYVTTAPLLNVGHFTWHASPVYKKLQCVLWVPIYSEKSMTPGERVIGNSVLWRPSFDEAEILQSDWEELMDMICLGQLEKISAGQGEYLHIRPKGANKHSLTWGIDAQGNKIKTLPRGFYLRTQLTRQILQGVI